MLKKTIKSFGFATRGIKNTWQGEINFRLEIILSLLALILSVILKISSLELTLIIFAIFVTLTVEIFNTAFENVCDKIEPRQDNLIAKIKDMSAGAVLLTSLGSLAVGAIIFIPYLIPIFKSLI